MCGRAYQTYTEEELYLRYLNARSNQNPLGLKANYNLSPTQLSPVVIVRDNTTQITMARWGLIPAWAADVKSASKYSLINARGEEILEKRSYKDAFIKRRCIVPISGFIEWKRDDPKTKRPFAIHLKSEKIMSVAGVWEHWTAKDNSETIDSFSIITTAANSFMQNIHERMPVILPAELERVWLDPSNQNGERMHSLLQPCPASSLEAYEISAAVNSPKNNNPELLAPIKNG